jgi:predicted DNA-binding transcriptional regulator AlpA
MAGAVLALAFFTGTLMPKGLQRQNHFISPRGLRADDAATYLGMGKTKFFELVEKGTMPRAFTIDNIKIWDRFDLDAVIDAAKDDMPTDNNSFDKIMRR